MVGLVKYPAVAPDGLRQLPRLLNSVEPYMAKRADGTEALAYRPVRNQPGCP